MPGLRLVLSGDVEASSHRPSTTMLPGLLRLIARWSIEWRPHWVRGQAGFSHDAVTIGLEAHNLPCLLKLSEAMDVKRFVKEVFRSHGWPQAEEGFEGREVELAFIC